MNSRRKYGIWWLVVIVEMLMSLIGIGSGSSIESCLSAYGVNLTLNYGSNATLPIECQCSETELICTNSAINNPQAGDSTFPTLSILFLNENSSLYYLLPKQRLTFWGYKTLLPNAFKGFKFVNRNGGLSQFNDQIIYLYFAESYRFLNGAFSPFGNLDTVDRSLWPKLSIEIFDNDLNNVLMFEKGSFANMSIDSFSVKYTGPLAAILSNAFDGSTINRLEIKNSPRFIGFTPFDTILNNSNKNSAQSPIVRSIIIDTCPSFVLNDYTLPNFTRLSQLTVKSSGLQIIPALVWLKFDSLVRLSLRDNQIAFVDRNAFYGIESQLVSLDLSSNPISNFDWTVFEKFSSLDELDLSYTSISTINSFIRLWPNPTGLRTLILKGYNNTLDNRTICVFNAEVQNGKINLAKTFVQFERTYQCDCFLFYIYKDYRRNPANLLEDWILANRTPICYESLYKQIGNFSLIELNENVCNFPQILDLFCPKSTVIATSKTSSITTTTTPCFSTQFSQPGQTTIIIGNLTSFATTKAASTLISITTTPCINPTTSIPPSTTTTTISTYTTSKQLISSTIWTTSPITLQATSTSSLTNKVATTTENEEESSTALPSLNNMSINSFNTTSIVIIIVLSVISLLLLFIILGLIIYFRNRLRSVSNSSSSGGSQIIGPTNTSTHQTTIRIDEKGNKHIYRV